MGYEKAYRPAKRQATRNDLLSQNSKNSSWMLLAGWTSKRAVIVLIVTGWRRYSVRPFLQDLRRSGPPGLLINLFTIASLRRERKVTFQDLGLQNWSRQVRSDKNKSRYIVQKTATELIHSESWECMFSKSIESELLKEIVNLSSGWQCNFLRPSQSWWVEKIIFKSRRKGASYLLTTNNFR